MIDAWPQRLGYSNGVIVNATFTGSARLPQQERPLSTIEMDSWDGLQSVEPKHKEGGH